MSDDKHITNHILKPQLKSNNVLHVIGVISNPVRYNSRFRLFKEWEAAMLATPNVQLHVVEAAIGDRHHEVTDPNNPNHLQLRTKQGIWIKENMINLGVRHLLPSDWKYLAWIDCDVFFRDPQWAQETLHQLQHYSVVQPWSDCLDLGHHGNILQHFQSFGYMHQLRTPKKPNHEKPYKYAHTGFAWACTRTFWENVKGLLDFCILGSGDHHLAWALIGEVMSTVPNKLAPSYARRCIEWQNNAVRITHKEVGYVMGRIEHKWHGSKTKRYYKDRWNILFSNNFDPDKDLAYDSQGLIHVIGKPKLVHEIHKYNLSRQEDGIDP